MFKSKRQVFDYIQNQLTKSYNELYDDQRLSDDSHLLKTFIFEYDQINNEINEDYIKKLFTYEYKSNQNVPEIKQIDDDFYEIDYKEKFSCYLELHSMRYWNLYSMSKSKYIDKLTPKIIQKNTQLDSLWFWPRFLEEIQNVNKPKGFGLDYDKRYFIEKNEDLNDLQYLKMQVWGGGQSKNLYDELKSLDSLSANIVLSKIRFKKIIDYENFMLEDIKYNSKLTSRGTNLDSHFLVVNDIIQKYSDIINHLKNSYQLNMMKIDEGMKMRGEPIYFRLESYEDIPEEYINKIFNGHLPFRLLGLIDKSKGIYNITVFDLHVGGRFKVIIRENQLIVYLSTRVCPNTIIRLFVNLIHTLGTDIIVEDCEGGSIFEYTS